MITQVATASRSYHAIRGHHAPRYLAEFEYRFNRRYDIKAMIQRFLTMAVETPPMLYRLMELTEPYAQSRRALQG